MQATIAGFEMGAAVGQVVDNAESLGIGESCLADSLQSVTRKRPQKGGTGRQSWTRWYPSCFRVPKLLPEPL